MTVEFEMLLKLLGCRAPAKTKAGFLEDAGFYIELLKEMLKAPGFEELGKQLKEGDAKAAFDTAHSLKGIIANCGIDPMLSIAVEIVEPLRSEGAECAGLEEKYEGIPNSV